jgi:hypothetical protein
MKKLLMLLSAAVVLLPASCTSGSEFDVRNKDIFDEAKALSYPAFTTTPISFDGGIQALKTYINGAPLNTEQTASPNPTVIEGIVTMPSDYGFAIASPAATPAERSSGCSGSKFPIINIAKIDKIYSRSFILQDANAGILVAYGLEPPIMDTAESQSMKYIQNARTPNMAVFGDRLRISVTKVLKYGDTDGVDEYVVPIVTDFHSPVVVSTRNSVPYSVQSGAFDHTADLYRVRQIEGYVTSAPTYVECASGTLREFQYNYQTGYRGVLCAGATSPADAANCTGTKTAYNFQLTKNLGAGTLSGFDTGDMFSYTIAKGAKVRLRGPIVVPQYTEYNQYNQGDTNLTLLLGQKIQAETLR